MVHEVNKFHVAPMEFICFLTLIFLTNILLPLGNINKMYPYESHKKCNLQSYKLWRNL